MSATTAPAPTAEQLQAEHDLRAGKSIEIVAVAGAGKTFTLVHLAKVLEELGKYGAYSCFNGSTAKEAAGRFPKNFLCQPDGTLVRVATGGGAHASGWRDVPIEDLHVGDRVVSWGQGDGGIVRKLGRPITDVVRRPYNGDLVIVETAGRTSRYTPEHPCMVSMRGSFEGKHLVYMMRRGDYFKIGYCRGIIRDRNRSGIASRIAQENADALWILSVHDTKEDALTAEALAQYRWQVPGWCFRDTSSLPIERLWSQIEPNVAQATACLRGHGRDLQHPLWTRDGDRALFARQAVIVAATNLVEGMAMFSIDNAVATPIKDGRFDKLRSPVTAWTPITVRREAYSGTVTSLAVAVDHTYFADGILTHNCSTAHGIATQASRGRDGRPYWHHRLNSRETGRGLQNARLVAKILGITDFAYVGTERLKPESIALLALNTVREFCKTADPEIAAAHVPCPRWMNEDAQPAVAAVVLPWARKAWDDMTARNGLKNDPSATGCLNVEHGFYLKRFQLSGRPIMVPGPNGVEQIADVLFVDECQDLSPVTLAIARRMRDVHGAQLVIVGDSMQAINRFAGAVDAIGTIPGMTRVNLTKSWRFGQTIAVEANKWLRLLDAPLRVVGNDAVTSTIGPMDDPDAILCRTGAGAMQAVIDEHTAGRKVHLVGKGEDMREIAQAALDLDDPKKGWTSQKDLKGFHSWQEVVTYCEQGELGSEDLDAAVKLIEKYDAQTIIDAINQLVGARAADVTICTAHVSKGLEWPKVRLGDDFRGPRRNQSGKVVLPERDELMLHYVAVTRAKERLDVGSLAWVNEWVPATQVTPAPVEAPAAAAEPAPSAPAAPAASVGRGTGVEAGIAVLRDVLALGEDQTDEDLADAVRAVVKAYLDPRPALQAVS